jgi:hypothetical protein
MMKKIMTVKRLCTKVGCSISQFGWAAYIGEFRPNNIVSIRAWEKRIKRAYGGSFPSRINYHRV